MKHLEAQVAQAVQHMLSEGDQAYLRSLTPDTLLKALQDELYFLGLYHRDDEVAQSIVHDYLRHHLRGWYQSIQKHASYRPAFSGTQH